MFDLLHAGALGLDVVEDLLPYQLPLPLQLCNCTHRGGESARRARCRQAVCAEGTLSSTACACAYFCLALLHA